MQVFNTLDNASINIRFNHNGSALSERQFVNDINQVLAKIPQSPTKASAVLFNSSSYDFAVNLFALAHKGWTIILPPNGQSETLNALLEQTPYYLGDSDLVEHATTPFENIGNLTTTPNYTPFNKIAWPSEGNLVFYTSGSSGQAKPIFKSWRVLNKEIKTLNSTFALKRNPVFIASVSHQHIYGLLFRVLWPLSNNHIIDTDLLNYPEHIATKLKTITQAVFISSPAQLKRLHQDNVLIEEKSHLQWVFSSGGPLQNEDAVTLNKQLNKPITQVFGSTETGGIAYRQVVSLENVSHWQPFLGITLHSTSEQRLVLNSPLVEQTNYLLDDRGTLFQNGQFELLGRFDRIIKLEEKRLSLDELELHLCKSEWVQEAKVITLNGKRLVLGAVIVLTLKGQAYLNANGKLATNTLLKTHTLNRFEGICTPKKWRFLNHLPYNTQAKINLKVLESLFVKAD